MNSDASTVPGTNARPPRARTLGTPRPLIAHVVYRFDVGGLENGVVNLINKLPVDRYDHAVISLTEVTDFRQRITRERVSYHELHKPPGHGLQIYSKLHRLFRSLAPAIVHTRNIAAMEALLPAALARVPIRIHGEHGWDVQDASGGKRSHHLQRRFFSPLVHHIESLFLTGKSPYPVERTLLTTGMTAAGIESLYQQQRRLETPHLAIRYKPIRQSTYWRT